MEFKCFTREYDVLLITHKILIAETSLSFHTVSASSQILSRMRGLCKAERSKCTLVVFKGHRTMQDYDTPGATGQGTTSQSGRASLGANFNHGFREYTAPTLIKDGSLTKYASRVFPAYPGPVRITGYQPGTQLARNSSLTLSCTSCGGHPTTNITWTQGDLELSDQVLTSTDPQNECVTGTLNLPDFRDAVYKVEFTCVASNGLKLNSSANVTVRLQMDGIMIGIERTVFEEKNFRFADIKLFIANKNGAEILQMGDNFIDNTQQPILPSYGNGYATKTFIYKEKMVLCIELKSDLCGTYDNVNNSWISGINYGFQDILSAATCYINRTHFWAAGGKVPGQDDRYINTSITIDTQGSVFPTRLLPQP